jgi:hypothetical protein
LGDGLFCPYGQPGDRLWVRETFAVQPDLWAMDHGQQPMHYLADISDRSTIEDYTGKPSIHMPRWASRITLEVTAVRVERLQEITEYDAIREGVTLGIDGATGRLEYSRAAFQRLWDTVAPSGSAWHVNPWVWVVSFRRVTP